MASVGPDASASAVRAVPKKPSDRQAPSAPLKTKPVESVPTPSPKQALPARDPYAQTEAFTQETLRLQAVSWSDVPSARVTIINGRILREGQSVDGYAVVQIRPKDVIIKKSGKQWKLSYDHH
jgi:hypothetical protein